MSVGEEKSGALDGGSVGRRRRQWSKTQKRQIVAETHEPGVSVPMVAQRYNFNANQIFRWRRLFRDLERAGGTGRFVPVVVEGAPSHEAGAAAMSPQSDDDVAVRAPATLFRYSRDRSGDHPVEHLRSFAGILQADVYAGYRRLYEPGRSPGSVMEALCWAHGRRKFYELADIAASKRRGKSAPLVAALEDWMRTERAGLSRHAAVAKAMDYMLKRWDGFARFLDDGRICLTNNAAERALRGIALGRESWLFAGSDRGGERAAAMYTLIGTAKLNDVDPQAWLADVLARIADIPQTRLPELLPWHWKAGQHRALAA